jgi:hypothetical protein
VRVALQAPATLVLGESYSSGWRAYCDGRSLGKPRVVDGYSNGWTAAPPCTRVRFAFAPDRPVHLIQLASALICLLLLVFVLLRPGRRADDAPTEACWPERPQPGVAVPRALALGLLAAAVLGFCFSLRSGLAIFAGVTLVAWRGVPARALALAAGILLALLVPALYLLFPAENLGGYNPAYAGDHIAGHWAAVAAYTLLLLALLQTLRQARSSGARSSADRPS